MLNGNEFFRFHIIVPRNAPLHDGYDTYDRFSDLISCVFLLHPYQNSARF